MIKYVIRRLGAALIQVLLVTIIAYLLFYVIASLTGANPAQRVAGRAATPQRVAEISHLMGIDRPIYEQYATFVWRLLHGDFGQSFIQRRPVAAVLFPAMGVTLSLLAGATILWMALAIPVGLVGAYWPRSIPDRFLGIVIQILISAPVFWVAPLVSYLLAYQPSQGMLFGIHIGQPIAWLPIQGYTHFGKSPVQWARDLLLPWLALALGYSAFYARFVRALVGEQLDEEYVLVARSKGAPEESILLRHIAPLVGPNLIIMMGLDVGAMLGGALFVEQAFGLPGMGFVAYSSIQQLDYPLTVGSITLAAILAVALNTAADILHAAVDPRVRK
jgi:peptide/nickel transport system permease protein